MQQIYNKYDFFSENILLTNHETLYYLDIVLSFYRPFEPSTALFTITGLWPKKQTPFYKNDQRNLIIQTNKHFIVYFLFAVFILENYLTTLHPTHITCKFIVQQNTGNGKEKYSFSYISIILYQKCFNLHSYRLISPLYNILYLENECALP